ncbi:MAG: hypothetical protein NZ901_05870 [Geminocystis sp.]|nr:hypothetical protein [Geminocystis sp.]MCS7147704.1 hypothetical protein [Geminocystis sp.]MCX8077580.1 hypothetical protein [Geminocystis sp.]HIK37950.1 hypothetical protein [Geminocystis sp. M7585_C2015_104]
MWASIISVILLKEISKQVTVVNVTVRVTLLEDVYGSDYTWERCLED